MSFGFGSTANTQSSAGTLFGAAASTPSTGGLFGSTNSSAGTLFGTNTNNSSAAGTLFGGSATATSAAPASTGFGGFGTQQQNQPATSNLFGPTTPAPATGAFGTAAPSTAFGGTSQPAASGFGLSTTSAPATSGFGGFGAPATSTANTGGFGSTTTNATTTGGFGGFGGFGSTTATSKPAFGGFGAPANTNNNSLFGNTNKPQVGFGAQQPQQQTGFGFGAQPQQQPQQMGAAPVQEKVWQDLALIRAHFDPTSPLCQFRHYFYNMVPSNEIHLYVRPQNQDEQLWNEAVRKNPDPANLVPVLATGFDDILKRMEIQSKQVELHQEKLKETADRLATVQRQYALGALVRLEEHKRRHTNLTQRLLRLLRYSQVLRYKGFPLSANEEQAMNELSQIATQPDNPEQLHKKMLVLWSQLQHIIAQRMTGANGKAEIWRTVSDEDTNMIAKVLEDEQKGIKHVASILKSDTKDLEDIEKKLREKYKPTDSYSTGR